MKRLEVKTSKVALVCVILLGLIFVPLALGSLLALKRGFKIEPILLAAVMLALFGGIIWLTRRGHARSVKVFTEDGLTRNDGLRFAWADLSCVVVQLNRRRASSRLHIWRAEIHFKNGECAWVIPNKVANFQEVRAYVDALPCEHKEVRV